MAAGRIGPVTRRIPTREQREAANPQHSVWVAASAGSGKTQVLVDRVIRLLLEGAAPETVLCLTFTKAAAAEMSERLFKRLAIWIACSEDQLDQALQDLGVTPSSAVLRAKARRLFARTLETPGGLKIQTIHAFCERLLQLFPVESGMAPGFSVLEEQETKQLFHNALLRSLTSENPTVAQAWGFLSKGYLDSLETLEELTRPFLSSGNGMRQRLSNFEAWPSLEEALRKQLQVNETRSEDDIRAEICDVDRVAYKQAIDILRSIESGVAQTLHSILQAETQEQQLALLSKCFLTGDGTPRKKILKKKTSSDFPDMDFWFLAEQKRVVDLFIELALTQTLDANLAIYRAMATVLAQVQIEKRAHGQYDFDDLIARAAQLLEGENAAQWVLYKLDKGLNHILVDEAQDTSPDQWRIIRALAGEFFTGELKGETQPRTMFAVGDIKQSIYSFQGADVAAFEESRKHFETALQAQQSKLYIANLAVSYRSNREILKVVDGVFAPASIPRTGFGKNAANERDHEAYHTARVGLVELWDYTRPDDKEDHDNWKAPVDRKSRNHPRLKLAEHIASTIKSWLGKRELSGQHRAVRPGDILILLQRRNDLFNGLIGALRRQGVPVSGADRLTLQNSLIVKDLLMLGHFIRLPNDDHGLACLLKSPLVPEPLTEDQLFALAYDRGEASLWSRVPTGTANHQMLQEALATQETPFVFFSRILQQAKQRILERLGAEADDAAQEFIALSLDYEQRHGTSLTGFMDWLSADESVIKREMEAGLGEVRLMTVHGSKGLEAPIVFLADAADPLSTTRNNLYKITGDGPWRGLQLFLPATTAVAPSIAVLKDAHKAEMQDEKFRLLYVGLTRAADELYICGSKSRGEPKEDAWYFHVAQLFGDGETLSGVSMVTDDPALTKWRFGAEPVALAGEAQTLIDKTQLPEWVSVAVPNAPYTLSLVASRNSDAFDRAAVKEGLATHRLLEVMAETPLEERLGRGKTMAKRLHLSQSLVDRLHEVFQRPDLAPLLGPHGQSEVAVDGLVPGLGAVSGRIDRMAITEDCIFLLDYKTNRNPPIAIGPTHSYARQMARYKALLQLAFPHHSFKAGLLWTQSGAVMWLDQHLLSQALDQLIKERA
jgi:ATP-dependent helicase/nuclease subunit A